ncbi:MAG: hypothetical protein U5J98_10685 [Halobacteriales archaeon]|nr:hypothetical protein [Halobacteriales archaeon]
MGPVDEIFESPRHPYTQALLESVPGPTPRRPAGRSTCSRATCPRRGTRRRAVGSAPGAPR